MRKVQLTAYDFGMFDCDISPTEYDFFLKHKGAFKRMWSDQGKKFWNRFMVCFRAFSRNYGAIKEFPVKSDKYEAYIDQAFMYIHDQFVEGKVSTAKGLVLDTVVVAQNRQSLQYLESQSFAKDPFYNKDTRDVFRRLFGQPGEKSSYVKVYFLIPLYVKFGGSVCRCLRHWLEADEIDSADESYYIPPDVVNSDQATGGTKKKKRKKKPKHDQSKRSESSDSTSSGANESKAAKSATSNGESESKAAKTTTSNGANESKAAKSATSNGAHESKAAESATSNGESESKAAKTTTSNGANESKAAKSESAPSPMLGAVIAPNSDSDPTLDAIIAAVLKNNVEVERMQREASAAKRAAAAKESEACGSAETAPSAVGQKSSNPSSPVRPKANKKDTFVANEDSPLVQKLEETFGLPKPAQTKKGQTKSKRDKSPPIKISVSGCEEGKKKLAEAEKRGERTSATVNVTVTFDREVRDQITPEKTKAAFEEVLHNMYTKPPKERLSSDPRERKEQIRERLRRKHACKDMPQVLDCHWASDLRRAEAERAKEKPKEEMFDMSKEDMAKKLSELCKLQPDRNNPWAAQGPPVPPPAHLLKMADKRDAGARQSSSTQTTEVHSAETQTALSCSSQPTQPSSSKTAPVPLKADTSVPKAASSPDGQTTTHSTEVTPTSPSPKSEGAGEGGRESIIVILDEDKMQKKGDSVTEAGEERRGARLVELKPNGEEEVLESKDEEEERMERRAKAVAEQIALLAGIPPQGKQSLDDDALQHADISKYVRESTVENPIMFDGQLLSPGDKIINVYHPPGTPGIPLESEMRKRIKVLGKQPDQQAGKKEQVKKKDSELEASSKKKVSDLEAINQKISELEASSKKKVSETSPRKKNDDSGIRVTGDDDGIRVRGDSPTKKPKEKSTKSSKPTDVQEGARAKPKGGVPEKKPSSGQPSKGLGADAVEKIKSGMFAPFLKGKNPVVQDFIEGPGCALIGMYIPQNPDNPDKDDRIGMMRVNETMSKIRDMKACQEKWDLTHEEFDEITLNGMLQLNDQLVIDYLAKKNRTAQAERPAAVTPAAIEEKKVKKTGKLRSCSNCGQIEPQPKTFKTCQRCKEKHSKYPRFYCGRDCQIEDWGARHKQEHVDMD
ncbi:Hypp3177 [Branchiostoma lanceolatum]|uniref:Hypp3177 protein n=1 Tax=Branchiostoma lanceolatum TaxID=7740 RepID=A0A8K0A0C0_BRALA|nr:Hypp3177 [Branchiostoma lanceolatum]